MAHQSGEPSGHEKQEGLKNTNTSKRLDTKKNDNVDEKEFEKGGNNKGGKVPGAFGNNDKADGHRPLKEGM